MSTNIKNRKLMGSSKKQNEISPEPTVKDVEVKISESSPKICSPKLQTAIESKYTILQKLGKGSYGTVYKGMCLATGRLVALKVLENVCKSEYDTIKLVREIQLMRRLNRISTTFVTELIDIITPSKVDGLDSKNTDSTYGSDKNSLGEEDNLSLCIVLDFIDTDLDQLMKRSVEIKEKHLLKIMYSLFCSLCFLHKCNVMHRDLKCANILVNS